MSDIGPGDWVECVNVTPFRGGFDDLARLMIGALYQVIVTDNIDGVDAVLLVGVRSNHWSGTFGLDHFRPIRDDEQKIERYEVLGVLV